MLRKILLILSAVFLFSAGTFAQEGPAKDKKEASASTIESATKPAAFRPTKDQIKKGQEILIKQKLWDGEATGIYGECRPAIKAYQKANGLEQNGKFDRPTLAKMNIALTDKQKGIESTSGSHSSTSTSDGPKRPAPFQATKDQISALQAKLKEAKLFSGDANGERSDELKDAVKKYQDKNGLKATGGINAATLEKMGIALTDKQKANVAAQKAYDGGKDNKDHKDSKESKDSSDKD
jgi:peptidoglycan hydrolase-like protein with peptidoglycan-binding domain